MNQRKMTDLTFEEAIAACQEGYSVRRAYWGRKKQDCYLLDEKARAATDWLIVDRARATAQTNES